MKNLLKTLLFAYLGFTAYLYAFQRSQLYHPDTEMGPPSSYNLDMREIELTSSDGINFMSWYREAKENMPTILYFHGNAGHLGLRNRELKAFLDEGFGVMAVSYRGYGNSEGKPSENGFYKDAEVAMFFLAGEGVESEDVIAYGESIGTGTATYIASYFDLRALVLEAPFTSVYERAQEMYRVIPAKLIVKDKFDNASRISNIGDPLLIIHGDADEIIPIHHGRKLYALASEPKKMLIFKNTGHDHPHVRKIAKAVKNFVFSGRR